MRIAFLGKGGSGKTTLSGLFTLYADSKGYRAGLLDVDVNSHTADVLGLDKKPTLSKRQHAILTHLAGANKNVKSSEFLNTTPPGTGSNCWTLDADNPINTVHAAMVGERSIVLTTGSYEKESIGLDCHHSTQSIAENLLSHARLGSNDIVVTDCVAGSDLFGTTLYDQDMIVVIAKPEPETVSVIKQVEILAKEAGMKDRLVVLANQVQSESQKEFVKRSIPSCKGIIELNQHLVDDRLNGKPLGLEHIDQRTAEVFDMLLARLQDLRQSDREHYDFIVKAHKKVTAQGWVDGAYRPGLVDQIDMEYNPDATSV